jgi:hypothetical protein
MFHTNVGLSLVIKCCLTCSISIVGLSLVKMLSDMFHTNCWAAIGENVA